MADVIEVRTEERADGWAVVVVDKFATHAKTGMTAEEAEQMAEDILKLIHQTFKVKEQA